MSDSIANPSSHTQNGQKNRILIISLKKSKAAIAIPNISQENGYTRGSR
jgi:ribosomal protein S8